MKLAPPKTAKPVTGFSRIQSGIQKSGGNPCSFEGVHLIFHESNQWGDDYGKPGANNGWELIAKGLATPRREQRKDIAPGKGCAHDLLLMRTKCAVAEVLFQGNPERVWATGCIGALRCGHKDGGG
jgi:hypothetical protein